MNLKRQCKLENIIVGCKNRRTIDMGYKYNLHIGIIGTACCSCAYAGEKNGRFFCNCGDSENYEKEIYGRNYCDDYEEN